MTTRKNTTATGRSGGKVDAPGKAHRGAPAPTPGIKKSNLMIPKANLRKQRNPSVAPARQSGRG
jgi:hypothetical protein